jgi:hypothetical protein
MIGYQQCGQGPSPRRARIFLFPHRCVQTGSGTHPAMCPVGIGGSFTWVRFDWHLSVMCQFRQFSVSARCSHITNTESQSVQCQSSMLTYHWHWKPVAYAVLYQFSDTVSVKHGETRCQRCRTARHWHDGSIQNTFDNVFMSDTERTTLIWDWHVTDSVNRP